MRFKLFALTAVLAVGCSGATTTGTDNPGIEPGGENKPDASGNTGGDGGTIPGEDGSTPQDPWNPPSETGNVSFPYKAYRCGYTIQQVSPAKPAAVFHEGTSTAAPKNLHLTFAGDAAREIVIQWSSDEANKATEVKFGDAADKLDKTARGFSFTYGVSNRRQHEVHLCGLSPNRTYYYSVNGSQAYAFVTAPDDASDIDVLVIGDTRTDPSVLTRIWSKAKADAPQVMVLSGDAVADGDKQNEWDALFAAAPELFATVPGIWAHGNHEGLSELYFAQFAMPDHGKTDGIEEWYATTYGPMKVLALNDTTSSSSHIGVETTFIDDTLTATDRNRTPFIVGLHHKPMYTTSLNHGSNTQTRSAWGPIYDKHHVNIDIAGHVHSYESTHAIKAGTTTVVTDQTGTRFINYGGGGAPLYNFSRNQDWINKREKTYGYAIMTIGKTQIGWTAKRDDGSVIETFAIAK